MEAERRSTVRWKLLGHNLGNEFQLGQTAGQFPNNVLFLTSRLQPSPGPKSPLAPPTSLWLHHCSQPAKSTRFPAVPQPHSYLAHTFIPSSEDLAFLPNTLATVGLNDRHLSPRDNDITLGQGPHLFGLLRCHCTYSVRQTFVE